MSTQKQILGKVTNTNESPYPLGNITHDDHTHFFQWVKFIFVVSLVKEQEPRPQSLPRDLVQN